MVKDDRAVDGDRSIRRQVIQETIAVAAPVGGGS